MMVNIENLREKNFEEKKEIFLQIQNFICKNLDPKDRKEYQNAVSSLDNWDQKIKMANSFMEIAEKNKEVEEIFKFIKTNFPEEFSEIRKEYENTFDNQKLIFLNNKFSILKEVYDMKIEDKFLNLQIKMRNRLNSEDYDKIVRKIDKIIDYDEKLKYLESVI